MTKNNETIFKLEDKIEGAASKIDIIKNLIFGDTIQEYNAEFEALKNDMLQKKESLESLMEEIRTDLHTTIDTIATDVNIRITELEKSVEDKMDNLEQDIVQREQLSKLFIEIGKKIASK